MRRSAISLFAAIAVAAGAGTATASSHGDDDKAEKMVEYRKAVFTVMAHNLHPLGGMVKGKMPYDPETFARKADNIAAVAPMAMSGFRMQATADAADTEAKAAIWDNRDDFKDKMQDMVDAADRLAAAEPGDSAAAMKKQVKALADTCENCHDDYKED